ncbi:PorP/SprF family type IX secretion system membrane protein [Membranihabitans maritimus]|uniref:PorP/SprF family type IX secretion system membrane protein n=1 Tax=Membranihabitans maritimus TaxID=2904244 RepID=UPI001F332A80|nr:PorP/SprF family type IX secretion system membrane protein [Membranihabitans maritimus]
MKLRYIVLGFVFTFLLGIGNIRSQDIHYSQFYMAPLHLNPAMAGVMNCNYRVIANYRNQWATVLTNPFNTFSASYDQKIPVGRSDYFGWGASAWGDVAGEAKYKQVMGRLTGSFSKKLFGDRNTSHYLVAGADVGINQRGIDVNALRFGSQYDPITGVFDPGAPPDPSIDLYSPVTFFDVSGGLLWFSVFDERTNFYAGVSMAHMNKPNISLLGNDEYRLYQRWTFHGGGEVPISNTVSLVPGFVVFDQGPSFEGNIGNSFRFDMGSTEFFSQSFEVGAWLRMVKNYVSDEHTKLGPESVILSARFNYNEFGIGFSYDWNISELREASRGNGAFEFSLNYLICGAENRGVYCPTF